MLTNDYLVLSQSNLFVNTYIHTLSLYTSIVYRPNIRIIHLFIYNTNNYINHNNYVPSLSLYKNEYNRTRTPTYTNRNILSQEKLTSFSNRNFYQNFHHFHGIVINRFQINVPHYLYTLCLFHHVVNYIVQCHMC